MIQTYLMMRLTVSGGILLNYNIGAGSSPILVKTVARWELLEMFLCMEQQTDIHVSWLSTLLKCRRVIENVLECLNCPLKDSRLCSDLLAEDYLCLTHLLRVFTRLLFAQKLVGRGGGMLYETTSIIAWLCDAWYISWYILHRWTVCHSLILFHCL